MFERTAVRNGCSGLNCSPPRYNLPAVGFPCSAFCCCSLCALFGCALCGFDFAALTGFCFFCGLLSAFSACGCSRSILGFLRAVCRPAFTLYGFIIAALRAFPCCCVSYCLIGLLFCPFSAIPACGGLLSVRAALRAFLRLSASVNVLSASYAVKPRARVGRAVVLPRGCVWFYAFILSAALLAACSVV